MQDPNNLIWVDLEMTGLEPEKDKVIEIATIITDSELNTLAEGPVIAIHQSDEILHGMDEWNTTHHYRSGLVARVRASDYDEDKASAETLAFLEKWVPSGASPMCGNSICQDPDAALAPGTGARLYQDRHPPGPGRHPRVHRRDAVLPGAFPAGGVKNRESMVRNAHPTKVRSSVGCALRTIKSRYRSHWQSLRESLTPRR
jgi:hypothetical protein